METGLNLISNGNKMKKKKRSYVQNLLYATILLGILAIIKVPRHSKLNSLEAKGNHLTDISTKHSARKGTNNQTLLWSKGIFPDNLESLTRGFPSDSDSKESAFNSVDLGSIHGSGRSPVRGAGYPHQYSCLENTMDRWAWQATVHGIAKSRTQLSN